MQQLLHNLQEDNMSLTRELKKLKEKNLKMVPKEISDILLKDIEINAKKGITKNALKIGNKIPMFELKNALGVTINSYELLFNGPLIISFYRGAWCPYCNMELISVSRSIIRYY
jgi:thiol-disulfide isomerase/thioredoxin